MKKSLLFSLILCAVRLSAQITLNSGNLFDAGDRIINGKSFTALDSAIVPGSAGPAQTWNFATTSYDIYDTLDIFAPGWLAPTYTSGCPQTTHVIHYGPQSNIYDLIVADASGFYIAGSASYDPVNGVQTSQFQDYVDWMHWPATYGQFYNDTAFSDNTIAVSSGSIDSMRTIVTMYFSSSIDAWGTMTISSGTFNALRLQRQLTYSFVTMNHDTITGWDSPSNFNTAQTMYEWWSDSPGIGFPIVTIYTDPSNGDVTQYEILHNSTTSVAETPSVNTGILVYPSPASVSITIQSEVQNGTWEVQDISGRVVSAGVINSTQTPVDVSQLPDGIYNVIITDKEGSFLSEKFVKSK